jgi:thymidylate synthase (FAD)
MKIVNPSVKIELVETPEAMLKRLEKIGRVCYQSEGKTTEDSYIKFIGNIVARKHLAIIEHASITWNAITDRGVANEIVRHRLASYAQESTRYVKYDDIEVIKPAQIQENTLEYSVWHDACKRSGMAYKYLIEHGVTPQNARSILPLCLKTEIVSTMNLRELRTFFELRCAPSSHPDMVILAKELLKEVSVIPVVFDDLYQKFIVS